MKAHLLLQSTFHNTKTRESISGVEYYKDAQFFDFGYISDEQIVEESGEAMEGLFEGFLRLPAQHCVFELRHQRKGKPDRYAAYEYRYDPTTNDTIFAALHVKNKGDESFYFNALVLGWEVLTPEAQVNWRLTRSLSMYELDNPHDVKWGENDAFVGALTTALACMLGRLNAKGMDREYIEAPEKLNKARTKKGKAPLVSYTKVKVSPYRTPLGHSGPREEFTPPRYHFRRGHVRRFTNGGKTWVRPCFVGCPETGGRVEHTYEVSV